MAVSFPKGRSVASEWQRLGNDVMRLVGVGYDIT
jgi:hypothetical protein